MLRRAADVDGYHPKGRIAARDGAYEPSGAGALVIERHASAGTALLCELGDCTQDDVRHSFTFMSRARRRGSRLEINDAAAGDHAKVILNGRIDLGWISGDGQSLRERVECSHLVFAILREHSMGSSAGRKLPGHRSNDDEQDQIEELRGIRHTEIVDQGDRRRRLRPRRHRQRR